MKRLDLYVGRAVLTATLLAWLVVAVLDSVFSLLGQLGDIGRGNYAFKDALAYVLFSLPTHAYQAFPMAALIGTVLGLGNLAAQAELTAFRLSGCSARRLGQAVMQAGLLMVAVITLLGELLAPPAQQLAQQLRSQAIYDDVSVQRDAGFWVRDGRRFIQVKQSMADGSLAGVVVYQLADEAQLAVATTAQRATPKAQHWELTGVRSSRFLDERVEITESADQAWPALMDARLAQLLTRDAATLSLPELDEYIEYLQRNGSPVMLYALGYWQRIAAPLSALAMLLLAVSLVLGPLGRSTLGQRLLVAVLAGLAFKLLSEVIAHAGLVYGLPPAASAFLPALLVLAVTAVSGRRI
jgi:lipopolysaccharide export system permease protein